MSECDICVAIDADDTPDVHFTKTVRARKRYGCCECGRFIEPGEMHQRVNGKWEGKFGTYRTCGLCAEIRSLFFCSGWIYGEMWEGMREQAFERLTTASPCFIELSAAAKEFVLQMWREWKFDV